MQRPSVRMAERRKRLALLLPGHNEELIIATTIRSAVKAGQHREDIFVVDDNSSDNTRREALKELPAKNVLTIGRSGKAGAVKKAIEHFTIEDRYTWLHVADADSIFCPDYFRIYRNALDSKRYVAAVGFVKSLRGNWIARYRSFSYTYGQHIFRRIQGWFGMISVMPGPVTCFQTSILKDLDFATGSLTEDYDLTLQIHRKRLGRIRFIPGAVNYTQDPKTMRDFIKQTARWQRGFFQGVKAHHIGIRPQRIDISIGYQLLETLLYLIQLCILIPYALFGQEDLKLLTVIIAGDYLVLCVLAVLSAAAAKRLSILLAIPSYYPLRFLELGIFLAAFVEVMVLKRFSDHVVGWETGGRRYKIDENALKDVAQ
ncbi:MAG: glycosyltransferase family 2 protein [Patescibacteria group bacterium]